MEVHIDHAADRPLEVALDDGLVDRAAEYPTKVKPLDVTVYDCLPPTPGPDPEP